MSTAFTRILVCLSLWAVPAFARIQPEEPTVEIKCLVPSEKAGAFLKKLDLGSKVPLTRVVCFFDTQSLSLYRHKPKLILRSRYDSSNEADTTVKVRDGRIQGGNVRCEFDKVLGKKRTMSCSIIDKTRTKAQIKKANAGKHLKQSFSKEQEATLEGAIGRIDWQNLRPFGPVREVQVWKKIKLPGGPDVTVERWKLPAHQNKPARVLLEVSAKVELAKEASTSKWIADLVGVPESGSDQESETKIRIVLEHFKFAAR